MSVSRLRRAVLAAASLACLLIASCGGGTVVSQFQPNRAVAFGDAFGDLGQRGARYTINDGTVNVWSQRLAARYGLGLTTAAAGGTSYAEGSARVAVTPDAAGNATTRTVTAQVDAFRAAGNSFTGSDLVMLQGGIGDVVAEMQAVVQGTQTLAQAQANVEAAGRALGALVRSVANSGATHIAVAGTYNLGRSPWAAQIGQTAALQTLSSRFNEELLVSIADLGARVLYVDAAFYYNLVTSNPASYGITDVTNLACASVDAGAGIGTGTGQVSSAFPCTTSTLTAGVATGTALFADRVYFTPLGNILFDDHAFERLRARF